MITKNVKNRKLRNDADFMAACEQLLSLLEGSLEHQHYITSFSEIGDSLSQWRAYCKRGGVSIGFSPNALLGAGTIGKLGGVQSFGLEILKVRYISDGSFSKATSDLLEFFDIWLSQADNSEERQNLFENTLGSVVCHYKHDGFSEECEWRLVVSDESPLTDLRCDFRCSASMLIPYKVVRLLGRAIPARSLDQIITEVIIGPGPHMELNQRSIRMYFDQLGLKSIPVRCSSIPYRDW